MRPARVLGLPALLLWTALGLGPASVVAADTLLPLTAFPRERIAVETRSARRHVFSAWRADTPQTRAQGLMFVERLRPEQAMIFVYEPPQRVGMWMMNTLIQLDMLFVDRQGCVVHVHERAQPGALDTISADAPVVLVVELAGGTAANLGIKVGDRVVRPDAGWPAGPATCPNNR